MRAELPGSVSDQSVDKAGQTGSSNSLMTRRAAGMMGWKQCLGLLLCLGSSAAKLTVIGEDDWKQLMEGEWMVEL